MEQISELYSECQVENTVFKVNSFFNQNPETEDIIAIIKRLIMNDSKQEEK